MDYARIYKEFIADRRAKEPAMYRGLSYHGRSIKDKRATWRGAPTQYYEHHHIVASFEGGNNSADNIIALTPEDHFFAHALLAKAYGDKHWAALWAMGGMRTGKRDFGRAIKARKLINVAREKTTVAQQGAKSVMANTEQHKWINYSTGEILIGSRHDLCAKIGHGKAAAWEVKEHLSGKTILTRSGWFSTTRFKSIKAVDAHKKNNKKSAAKATKAKNSGSNNPNATAILCVDTGIVYATQREAANATGAHQAKISEVCNGKRNKAGGYRWAYAS
jgi:hypothetical protein